MKANRDGWLRNWFQAFLQNWQWREYFALEDSVISLLQFCESRFIGAFLLYDQQNKIISQHERTFSSVIEGVPCPYPPILVLFLSGMFHLFFFNVLCQVSFAQTPTLNDVAEKYSWNHLFLRSQDAPPRSSKLFLVLVTLFTHGVRWAWLKWICFIF